jgi:surface antigen
MTTSQQVALAAVRDITTRIGMLGQVITDGLVTQEDAKKIIAEWKALALSESAKTVSWNYTPAEAKEGEALVVRLMDLLEDIVAHNARAIGRTKGKANN